MSDKDRQKKDGERKAGQEPAELPRDKSNHLIGDDETAEQLKEDAS